MQLGRVFLPRFAFNKKAEPFSNLNYNTVDREKDHGDLFGLLKPVNPERVVQQNLQRSNKAGFHYCASFQLVHMPQFHMVLDFLTSCILIITTPISLF
jgi:hypothetical protein